MKRTRRTITHDNKDADDKKEAADSEDSAKKDEKKQKEESDDEQETDDKEKEKKEHSEEDDKGKEGWKQKMYNFFMEPNGGGPNYENWLKLAVLGGLAGYYAFFM